MSGSNGTSNGTGSNGTPGKRGRGRPSKYEEKYAEQAYKLCLLGATDAQMADFFGVSESTINLWKIEHLKFSESIRAGKDQADAAIAESLFHRAKGYSHPEDKIFNANGQPLIVPTTKHYPPDTMACQFWLKNRQPAAWRDKIDHEYEGEIGLRVPTGDEQTRIDNFLDRIGDAPVSLRSQRT